MVKVLQVREESHKKRSERKSGIGHFGLYRSCEEHSGKPWERLSLLREGCTEGREGVHGRATEVKRRRKTQYK